MFIVFDCFKMFFDCFKMFLKHFLQNNIFDFFIETFFSDIFFRQKHFFEKQIVVFFEEALTNGKAVLTAYQDKKKLNRGIPYLNKKTCKK